MQVIRKALRVYLNQYSMTNYSDYPKPPPCGETVYLYGDIGTILIRRTII